MPGTLLFAEIPAQDREAVAKGGLVAPDSGTVRLMTAPALLPEDERPTCILAIDSAKLDIHIPDTRLYLDVPSVPPEAILNIDPWMPLKAVPAAGGIVLREGKRSWEIISIFRKGVWDLPKGKIDPNETPPAAALREVKEEVGISKVRIVADLGTTLHGYPYKDRYCIKTTYWYQMQTAEEVFVPQAEEGIEEVAWITWTNAKSTLGYGNLRELLARVEAEGMLTTDL